MKGKWIWLNEAVAEDSYGEFQAAFSWSGERAILKLSADSEYAVFVGGKFVYGGQYADFPWYKIHDTIDLTPFLQTGKNDLRIWVWYCGDENFCHYINRPAVRFAVELDGQTAVLSGAGTSSRRLPYFLCGQKKFITSQIGYSFSMDYTMKKEAFRESVEVDGMPDETTARPMSLLTQRPFRRAGKIGEKLYDLGCESVGFPIVKFKAKQGEKITVSFGEWLREGRVPRIIGNRDFSFTLVGNGEWCEAFNPLRKLGCRYFEIEGDAEIEEIGLFPLVYPFVERGRTEKYSPLREKIYETAVETLKLNAMEHYYDCPWREQGFYALDSRFQMRYGYEAFENTEYQYANLKLMSEDRNGEGMMSIVAPTSHKLVIPSFALFYIVEMEEYATTTGDLRLVKDYFEKMDSVLSVFARNRKDGLVCNFKGQNFWNFYEWNNGLDNVFCEVDSGLNFTFLLAAESFIRVCKLLNREKKAAEYAEICKVIRTEINRRFYQEDGGMYRFNEEEGRYFELLNAYAVLTETATGERAARICEKLASPDSDKVECTLSMLAFKYDALLKVDKEKYAKYVLEDIDRKYAYMLDNGATSFWETMLGSSDFGGAGSLCHGWSALPVYYYRKLL